MGLSRIVSEIDGDFSRKSQNFPTPFYLVPRWRGSPCNLVSAHWVKKLDVATGPRKKFVDIFSHLDTMHQRDRQTGRRTPGHSKDQRPHLRIASRGKNQGKPSSGRLEYITSCARGRHNIPPPLQVDLWPLYLESGVRVTCVVGYLCANFSLPRPLCSQLRPDVRGRQTDVRQTERRQTRIIA